jgi:4-amino-4-deoxy-L-arabinose transferase-like glycosyltransferase
MASPSARSFVNYLLLAGFCGFLFFFGLNYFGLVGADEPRYAQIAREMLERGDWVTPTLGGKPWLEKPVLYYWQAIVAYRLFGVSDWTARLPSAVDAGAMVLAIYFFLRKIRPAFDLDGALITASMAGVIGFARAASTDMPVSAMFTIGMLSWWAWRESSRKVYLALFFVFLALGTLAKGPVTVVLAVIILCLYALITRELHLLWDSLWLPGLLLYSAIALPWYVAVQVRNPAFFRIFILEHNFARFASDLYHHTQPIWYYLPVTLVALLPWTALAIAALWNSLRTFEIKPGLMLFSLIWFLVPVILFSVSRSKLPGYILPAVPAGALLVVEWARRKENAPRWWTLAIHSLIAGAVLMPAMMLPYLLLLHHLPVGRSGLLTIAISLAIAGAILVTIKGRPSLPIIRFVTLVPVVLGVAAILKVGAPAVDETLSARPVAGMIVRLQAGALPLAMNGLPRETEYGLQFYRNAPVYRYERGEQPAGDHILLLRSGVLPGASGRRMLHLGSFPAQRIEFYWVGKQ